MLNQMSRYLARPAAIALALLLAALGQADLALADNAWDIFRTAYQSRYTWDKDFPGYQAIATLEQGDRALRGTIRVLGDLSVEVAGIEDEDAAELVASHLKMDVIHRRRLPFEEMHAGDRFSILEQSGDRTYRLQEIGEDGESEYIVRNDILAQVNRTFGNIGAQVDTLATVQTEEGYITTEYEATFTDADNGTVLAKEDIRDFYERAGDYYLLSYREIRSTLDVERADKRTADTTLRFGQLQLLE